MDMVERVARALCKADGKNPDAPANISTCGGEVMTLEWQYHYPFAAMRAIEAMREPTDAMVLAGAKYHHDNWRPSHAREDTSAEDIWHDMIDAAIKKTLAG